MTDKKFVIENHSPYFLHPLEGPGVLITIVIFDGKNQDLWKKVVRTTLKAKNKLEFIKGTLKKPILKEGDDPLQLQAWEMANSIICSQILNVIDLKLQTSIACSKLGARKKIQNQKRNKKTDPKNRLTEVKFLNKQFSQPNRKKSLNGLISDHSVQKTRLIVVN